MEWRIIVMKLLIEKLDTSNTSVSVSLVSYFENFYYQILLISKTERYKGVLISYNFI